MLRSLFVLTLASISLLYGQSGISDPEFAKVPFDSWLTHEGETRMKWDVHLSRARLSAHERLITQIEAAIDGAELASRAGKGELKIFVQLTDSVGRRYQGDASLDLAKMEEGIRNQDVTCTMSLFVLPGNYGVSVALFDTATGEHSGKETKLHVDAVKDESLRSMWTDLPAVEFIDAKEPPDSWYLPTVQGRLHVPVATQAPLHIDLIVNLTPSEHLSASTRVQERNLGRLIPALKTFSQMDLSNGSLNIEALDLARQRITFRQKNARELNWPAMRETLSDTKPGIIDVKALEHRGQSAAFFAQEVARKVSGGDPDGRHVVIVLSSPMEFQEHEDVPDIAEHRTPDSRIFYIRYYAPMLGPGARAFHPGAGPGLRPMPGDPRFRRMPAAMPVQMDQLARTLKPLGPRVFDVRTPEEFHKAMQTILDEIARKN